MRLRILAVGGTIVLALSGCAGGHAHASPTTTSPTTTAINPDVVPPVITVAYVNAVLKVLFHVYDNAARSLASTHAVSSTVERDLRAVFNDPVYMTQVQAAQQSIRQGVINNVRIHGGDAVVTVKRLITATTACVFIETTTNGSALFIHPAPAAASEYYELAPKASGNDPSGLNATPWAISFNVAYLSPTSIASKCGAS